MNFLNKTGIQIFYIFIYILQRENTFQQPKQKSNSTIKEKNERKINYLKNCPYVI